MTRPKIAVLLAAYNGHKYIYEQVLSLISQKKVSVDVFIRVDGDCKIFSEIVSKLASQFDNVHYIKGDVLSSPSKNFYNLILETKDYNFDYYAFCDQDDVWCENKLIRAASSFTDESIYGYSSAFTTFNSSGRKKTHSIGRQTEFDYLFQSAGPGCTFVLSKAGFAFLQGYLVQHKELLSVLAHDWLIYFIMRLNKMKWFIDTESNILYRQHSSNVAGVNTGFNAKIKRMKLLFKGWYFSDLKCLFSFAKQHECTPRFTDVFALRRSKVHSFITWIYFWLYFRTHL